MSMLHANKNLFNKKLQKSKDRSRSLKYVNGDERPVISKEKNMGAPPSLPGKFLSSLPFLS
jgi:hypothetical protein